MDYVTLLDCFMQCSDSVEWWEDFFRCLILLGLPAAGSADGIQEIQELFCAERWFANAMMSALISLKPCLSLEPTFQHFKET